MSKKDNTIRTTAQEVCKKGSTDIIQEKAAQKYTRKAAQGLCKTGRTEKGSRKARQ
jgi:hypothetical protein